MVNFDHLLVTTDLSAESECGLQAAAEMAARFGSRLTLLSVIDFDAVLPPGPLALPENKERRLRDEMTGRVEKRLTELKDALLNDVKTVRLITIEGPSAAEAICDYAKKESSDLIVMSTRGRTGLPRLLLGSVAERVVRNAPCPVITLHPEKG